MQREIRFRGLRTDGKGWVYGYYFYDNQALQSYIIDDESNVDVFSESVGQFTGLKDKNGKDIYEGDIVKGVGVTSFDKPIIRAVAFCEKSERFGLTDVNGNITFEPLKWISFPLEIIRNIHEQKTK